MKKIFTAFLLTMAISLIASDASAYRGRPGPPPRHHGPFFGDVDRMQEILDLSEKQVRQIRKINEKFRGRSEILEDRRRPLLRQLRQLLFQENVDIQKVRKKLKEISDIEIELKILQIQHRMELKKILTPGQQKELRRERRRMRRDHHRDRRHHRRRMGMMHD